MSLWLIILCIIGYIGFGLAIGVFGAFDKMDEWWEVLAWLIIYPFILAIGAVLVIFVCFWMLVAMIFAILQELVRKPNKELESTDQASEQGSEPL